MTDAPSQMLLLRERLAGRVRTSGRTPSKVSIDAGLGRNAIAQILSGANENPSIATLTKIAEALDCDLEFLLGKQDAPRSGPGMETGTLSVPVAGTVEAGAFRAMSGAEPWVTGEHELERIQVPRSILFPRARHFAFQVKGDSMNAARPRAILEGEFALFVNMIDTEMNIANDKIYLVRRTRDAGQTFEWTLKRAKVFRDRIELTPESTNPAHRAVTIPQLALGAELDDGTEIEAVGLLYGMHYSYE